GPSIQHVYDLLHAKDHLRFVRFNFDHNYNQTSREAVYAWFDRWLLHQPDAASVSEAAYQKEPDAELRVFPDGKLPADAKSEPEIIGFLKKRSEQQFAGLLPRSKGKLSDFKRAMLPAWKHVLQLQWPVSTVHCGAGTETAGGTICSSLMHLETDLWRLVL